MGQSSEVELIVIGDELLKGARRDAHVAFIGRALARVGVRLSGAHVVGDDRESIARLVADRRRWTRVLLVSGGLGPTHDDVTREAVAEGLGLSLEFSEEQWGVIRAMFEEFGRSADKSNRRQAYFPRGGVPIPNPRGTAAGFSIEKDGTHIFVLPGPPRELNPMVEGAVLPLIEKTFRRRPIFIETFRTTGIGESAMAPVVGPMSETYGEFDVASLPHIGGVDVVITQKDNEADRAHLEARAGRFEKELRSRLGSKLYARGTARIEEVIGDTLTRRGETIALAESLTGGLIGKRLTDVAGSSRYFQADVVAYSNDAKVAFLGVNESTLECDGAVSQSVCREMADGIRQRTGATYGLATTGIAGPTGGSREKPVGLTFVGLVWDGGQRVEHRVFPGAREDVRERVGYAALFLLHDRLASQ